MDEGEHERGAAAPMVRLTEREVEALRHVARRGPLPQRREDLRHTFALLDLEARLARPVAPPETPEGERPRR